MAFSTDWPEIRALYGLLQRMTGRLHAARAHLLEMAGDMERSLTEYDAAASRTTNVPRPMGGSPTHPPQVSA